MAIKLVAIEKPEVPIYTRGVIDGIEAGCRLGIMMAYYFEGCDVKELSRPLEVAGPALGRNLDATIIETPCI